MRAAAILCVLAVSACVPAWRDAPHDIPHQREAPLTLHRMPKPTGNVSDYWDEALHSGVKPLARTVSPAHMLGHLVGGPPALDVNAFGYVPDSVWFENRIGRGLVSPADIRRGPDPNTGPAPGVLTVVSGKLLGVAPGIIVRDSAGERWYVKFDPPSYPELATGAEIVASRLLAAAGYHVPDMYLGRVRLSLLRLSPDAFTRDKYNRRVRMSNARLRRLLTNLNPSDDGSLRALFSRAVEGSGLGPFSYRGIRLDDPNDVIPHERRRSLRGLWVFNAWLNNTDTRRQNTLDAFVPAADGPLGYVKHYLIDFGDALGAAGNREKYVGEGYERRIEWPQIALRVLALGLYYPHWLALQRSPYRAIRVFESREFRPGSWSPAYSNPAFVRADREDTFWAAEILARFTREHIEAAVSAARYSEPGAAEWVVEQLLIRQRKLLRHGFSDMAPLSNPRVVDGWTLELDDLIALARLPDAPSRYRWTVRWNRRRRPDLHVTRAVTGQPRADLKAGLRSWIAKQGEAFAADPFFTVSVRRVLERNSLSPAVEVHLRFVRGRLVPVALERELD